MPPAHIPTSYIYDHEHHRNAAFYASYIEELKRQRKFGASGLGVISRFEAEDCFDAISKLTPGWDGKNSLAVSISVLANAKAFFGIFHDRAMSPEEIYATSNGTIIFEWTIDSSSFNLEIGKTKYSFYSTAPAEATEYGAGNIQEFPLALATKLELTMYGKGNFAQDSATSISFS